MRRQVSDLYPIEDVLDTGKKKIFDFLKDDERLSSFITSENAGTLNEDYYISHSADKFLSPLANKLMDIGLTQSEITAKVASIVANRFADKWKHLSDALTAEYDPLQNYSMEEIRTPDLEEGQTRNEKTDIKTERDTSASSKYRGFNSDDASLVSQTDGTDDVETTGAKADNETSTTTTHTGTETTTRSGNIGVTTSQQMLESELKVRQYDLYKSIYEDIDSVLCLSIY